jgi:type VI secretion system secreted protein Hcp
MAAHAVVDVFVKLDGVQGDSQDKTHKGEIVIENFTLSLPPRPEAPTRVATPVVAPMTMVKRVDIASPKLAKASLAGQHFRAMSIVMRRSGKEQQGNVRDL